MLAEEQINEITVSVCQGMLGIAIEPLGRTSLSTKSPDHFASIKISGDKNALIEVATCKSASNSITQTMFGTEGEADEEEIADAVSEIANMIGGNIKGALDCDCNLSIPCFSSERNLESQEGETHAFSVGQGTMQVTLVS